MDSYNITWSKPQLRMHIPYTIWEGRGYGEQSMGAVQIHLSMPALGMQDVAQDCPGDAR